MTWERPDFVEIGMNAEIGGYQSDFGDQEPVGPTGPVVEDSACWDAASGSAQAA